MKKKVGEKSLRFNGIDGLRAYAAIGIVLMHIKSNGSYTINGFISEKIIASMGEFVFLFMMISGFSMCCGYYDKILNNEISVNEFYGKRYAKIWPYFALLCFIDVCVSPSMKALYELFANLTLCFGLLPNANISVIGVGWFLGVVFVFYLIFPFFCYLLSNKCRAWSSFAIAIILNILCNIYFFDRNHIVTNFDMRSNIIYCAVFFIAGGLIYLYREQLSWISTKFKWIIFILCIIAGGIFIEVEKSTLTMLLLFSIMLIYSIGNYKNYILENKFTRFISSISMEIYLTHMMLFRVIEKLHITHLFSNDLWSYIIATMATLLGSIAFASQVKWIFKMLKKRYKTPIIKLDERNISV